MRSDLSHPGFLKTVVIAVNFLAFVTIPVVKEVFIIFKMWGIIDDRHPLRTNVDRFKSTFSIIHWHHSFQNAINTYCFKATDCSFSKTINLREKIEVN